MSREVPGRRPRVDPDAYVDSQAAVIGDVIIEDPASFRPTPKFSGPRKLSCARPREREVRSEPPHQAGPRPGTRHLRERSERNATPLLLNVDVGLQPIPRLLPYQQNRGKDLR